MRTIIDSHTHVYTGEAFPFLLDYRRRAGLEAVSIASFGCGGDGCCPEENILPLLFKEMDGGFFAYGSLIYPQAPAPSPLPALWRAEEQAAELMAMGCDGIKILESKPDSRKFIGLPLNGPDYEPFFAYLERNNVPVLWHVADPPEFWDLRTAPAFAVENGWTYDGSFLSWEALFDEVFDVLDAHPALRVVFAHFFFLSGDADFAQRVLGKYPNVCFDLTPGIEMYENFTARREVWRDFFIRNADRILFGTDTDESNSCIMCDTEKDPAITVAHIRRFLETEDEFTFWDRPVKGLALPENVLERIYAGNFRTLQPAAPKAVDHARLCRYAEKHLSRVSDEATRRYISEKLGLGD